MASIKDVAEKANVGKATVSRVLNNSGYVSDETRRKILNAMRELDYSVLDEEPLKSTDGRVLNQGLTDYFGEDIYMSVDYFKQVDASVTGDEVKSFIDSGKAGLLIYGDKDSVINPETYSWLVENTEIENICIKGMTHELGLEIDDDEMTAEIVTDTVNFIAKAFK